MTPDDLDRVALMAGDTQCTKWDLSPNDRKALAAVVTEVRALLKVATIGRTIISNIESSEQLHIAGSDAKALSRALDALTKETT